MSLDASTATFSVEQLATYIIKATQEVFSMMVMMDPIDDYPLKEPVNRFKCSITGMVGFAGIYSGVISIHCPLDLALKMTSNMLGVEPEEANEDLNDAIGEIANMLGGNIKQFLTKGGLDVQLSIPTVIVGEDYTVNSLSDSDCVVIPFHIDDNRFIVGLALTKED